MREIFFEVLRPRWHHIPSLGNEGALAIYEFVSAMMDWVNILYYPQIEAYISTQTEDTDMLDKAVDNDSKKSWRDMPPISDEAAYAICEFGTAIADWIKIVYCPQAEDYLNLQPEDVDIPIDKGDENSFDAVEIIFDRLLKKYKSKMLRFLLEEYDIEMRERSDPRQFYNDIDEEFGDNLSTPF